MNFFQRVMTWLHSLWSSFESEKVKDALSVAATMVDHLIPVIELIDEKLKPLLMDESVTAPQKIIHVSNFILNWTDVSLEDLGSSYSEIIKLEGLPVADMLANVALIIARRMSPDTGTSILRLAIELAYTIYKATKS